RPYAMARQPREQHVRRAAAASRRGARAGDEARAAAGRRADGEPGHGRGAGCVRSHEARQRRAGHYHPHRHAQPRARRPVRAHRRDRRRPQHHRPAAAMKRIPRPPHPRRRRKPLPWCRPKPAREDRQAPRRLAAILASPSYREAEDDPQFLKVESILERHRIAHTVLVLGSTRIDEKSRYYPIARELGRIVGREGRRGRGGRGVIVTGGGPGIMEAANRGAHDVRAPSLGLNISLPQTQYPNPYVTPELCFQFRYFALRKLHFLLRARALVAFPGGYGTFDELFETLTLVQTRKIRPMPIVLVGREYWQRAFNPGFLMQEGTIDPEDGELFWFAESAAEAWRVIRRWYRLAGEPVFPPLRLSDIKQRSAGARRIAL